MLKYSAALVALVATSTIALAAERMERGDNGATSGPSSTREQAPGQLKSGGSAKDFAPGQTKEEGTSAKDEAPGRLNDRSAAGSEKISPERKSENSTKDLKAGDTKHSESLDRDDKSLKGDKDKASTGASEGTEGRAGGFTTRSESMDRGDKNKSLNGESAKSSSGASEGTEGRAGGKGSLTGVTEEQRTRVKSVFSQHRVEPARGLNVSVNIGVAIPRSVHMYPVPEDIVLIVPEYRGYDYIMLEDGRVAIIDPDSFEIVDIIVVA